LKYYAIETLSLLAANTQQLILLVLTIYLHSDEADRLIQFHYDIKAANIAMASPTTYYAIYSVS
jgi:hypothetical protein